MTENHTSSSSICPACVNGCGLTRGVLTVPGPTQDLQLSLECDACGHEWTLLVAGDELNTARQRAN